MQNTQKTVSTEREQLKEQLRQLGVNIEMLEQYGLANLNNEALLELLTGLKGLKAYYDKRLSR